MNNPKRILVAYDGSVCANAALADLKKAGIPPKAEALVVTVADVFAPPENSELPPPHLASMPSVVKSWNRTKEVVKECKKTAEEGASILKINFPDWKINAEAFPDSPSWGIVKKASEWKADLIVTGAQGLHGTSRLLLGSLSQLVATQAACSVRIVHSPPKDLNSPARIVVGIDGSHDSYNALREVASRTWKKGTAVHVITAEDPKLMTSIFSSEKALKALLEKTPEEKWAHRLIEHAEKQLESKGLEVTSIHKEGDPKKILLEESKRWGADMIFVGARGLSGVLHSLLGSVSASVAARAECSVEIVRSAENRL